MQKNILKKATKYKRSDTDGWTKKMIFQIIREYEHKYMRIFEI